MAWKALISLAGVRVVPERSAWVVERLGRFSRILEPGLQLTVPLIERVSFRHSLEKGSLEVPEQACVTRDNVALSVGATLVFRVVDPRLASYGSADYTAAIRQLAQVAVRTEIGRRDFDHACGSREEINRAVLGLLEAAGAGWGIKVLDYGMKDLVRNERTTTGG